MAAFGSIVLALLLDGSLAQPCPGLKYTTPPENFAKVPEIPAYDLALKELNLKDVISDLQTLFTQSQECWPADEGNYGPLFVRLAWHCSGTWRITDGRGGCAGGRQRFEPERSWADNTNLDKARALLWPIKAKYGDGLSWGDLFILAGTTAIKTMGGPISEYCAGRIDAPDGTDSLDLGPSPQQEKYAPCPINGTCTRPLGSTTVGLIYLNPEGPVTKRSDGSYQVDPDPAKSARDVRDSFGRMGMNDSQTVALIGGGHTFGKTHGACPEGPGPSPREDINNPWPGKCGTGKGPDAFTSGMEGPWTTKPAQWDNEFFVNLFNRTWELIKGPGGHWQWQVQNAVEDEKKLMRLTSDVALLHDDSYKSIAHEFALNLPAFDRAFDEAWFKLTTSGGRWSQNKKCISGNDFPLPKPVVPRMRLDDPISV